jgi:hypothetical protein
LIAARKDAVKAEAPVKRSPLRWFVAMPARMALDPGLSHSAFRLASILLHFEGDRGCFPSQARLARNLSLSVDSVQRYIRELELYGFLTREKRRGFPNRYRLAPLYEAPIRHGSIEDTGDLEVENMPPRRPPAPRTLRVRRQVAAAPMKPLAPIRSLTQLRDRADSPVQESPNEAAVVAAPVRLPGNRRLPRRISVAASVRLLNGDEAQPVTAPVRLEEAALVRSGEPHGCGPNKNDVSQEQQQQERESPDGSGAFKEITGLGALQRAGVNISRRELGIHEARGRCLTDSELNDWASWLVTSRERSISNKPAFAAAKVRMGCTLDDIFGQSHAPAQPPVDPRRSQVYEAQEQREACDRIERADHAIEKLSATERATLRAQALNDGAVWIGRDGSPHVFELLVLAAQRRLVLGEVAPAAVVKDYGDRDVSEARRPT